MSSDSAANGNTQDTMALSGAEDDLDSIMQELENLDQEVDAAVNGGAETTVAAAAAPHPTPTPIAAAPRPTAVPTATPVPRVREVTEPVSSMRAPTPVASASGNTLGKKPVKPVAATSQALTMEITGTLNLKLGFTTGSKSVELICTDDALVCRFGDGTEVRIPTDNPRATTLRRTA